MENFEVIEFRFAEVTDSFDEKYIDTGVWSRLYEYKYVIDAIKTNMMEGTKPKIHNSSWGFGGVHVPFRDDLDVFAECLHSDIQDSTERDTYFYDITTEEPKFEKDFDFVLNVSTIEHLDTPQKRVFALENLWKQIKVGGYLILTFDYPRVNLDEIKSLINVPCEVATTPLNGKNSRVVNTTYKDLNIVYLILKKNG